MAHEWACVQGANSYLPCNVHSASSRLIFKATSVCSRSPDKSMAAAARAHAAQDTAESALDLLHWGYKSAFVDIDSSACKVHRRRCIGDCELVKLDLKQFCRIAKAKLQDVTSGVIIPAKDVRVVRLCATCASQLRCPLRRESEIDARFHRVVGSGVANVVNACIQQKHPSWKQLLFDISSDPSDGSGWPDFLIQQLRNDRFEVDVCGGEGESPDVMTKQIIDLTKMHEAVADALMQACSYCQEKGWRFTFITSYQYTFFIWRVAENRYAVTNGLVHDVAPFDLYTREVLALPAGCPEAGQEEPGVWPVRVRHEGL
ncbi:hypothetical protein HaLaN_22022, partial [Haematococcus lacustris]